MGGGGDFESSIKKYDPKLDQIYGQYLKWCPLLSYDALQRLGGWSKKCLARNHIMLLDTSLYTSQKPRL